MFEWHWKMEGGGYLRSPSPFQTESFTIIALFQYDPCTYRYEKFSPRSHRQGLVVELDASLRDDPNIPQVAVELIIVEPVPDDEAVGDAEATVPGHDGGVPAASSRLGRPRAALAVDALLQQRADLDRPAPAPLSQDREEAGEGDASVDDVLHHDHVPPLEAPVVEVLRHPDGARSLRPLVRRRPEEVEGVSLAPVLQPPEHLVEEDAGPLEDADQVRPPPGVVLVDQGGQLGRPGPDPGGRKQHPGEVAGVLRRVRVRVRAWTAAVRIDEGGAIRDVYRNEPGGAAGRVSGGVLHRSRRCAACGEWWCDRCEALAASIDWHWAPVTYDLQLVITYMEVCLCYASYAYELVVHTS